MNYQIGDMVVFTDEFGVQCVSRIGNVEIDEMPNCVAIDGSYGSYVRNVSEIRPAEHWEVHIAMFNAGVLK